MQRSRAHPLILTLAITAAGIVAALLLRPAIDAVSFAPPLAAVALCTWPAGLRAGAASLALATLGAVLLLLEPLGALALTAPQVGQVAVFVVAGALIAGGGHALRRSRRVAEEGRDATRALLLLIQDGVVVLDPSDGVVDVNDRFCAITGFPRAQLLGRRPPFPWWPDEERERNERNFTGARDRGRGQYNARFMRRDGTRFPAVVNLAHLVDAAGEPVGGGLVATFKDVSEREAAAERLRAQVEFEAALRRIAEVAVADEAPDRVFAVVAREAARVLGTEAATLARRTEDGQVLVAVQGFEAPLPLGGAITLDSPTASATALRTGRPARVEDHGELDPGDAVVAASLRNGIVGSVAVPVRVRGGTWGALAVHSRRAGALAPDAEEALGRFAHLVGLAVASADARAALIARATTDPLTGLRNHGAFHDRLRWEVERAQRARQPLALAVFDVDHFKAVNDRHGHAVGDRVLREVARRLAEHVGPGDTLGRVGGEEFAWIMPGRCSVRGLQAAEEVRRALGGEPFAEVGPVTLSGGVCDVGRASTAGELFRLADVALYWAKAEGRDAVVRYAPEVVEVLPARERVQQLERSRRLAAIRVLARAVDAKDPSTQAHSERVAELAGQLAKQLGWPAERRASLLEAALVHDVGKISVPDAILFKLGALTEEEYEQVKAHPVVGAQVLADALSAEQLDWVRHHHERFDGTGYPDRLVGDDVPEGAFVLAVADAWDAMTAVRRYGAARGVGNALRECRSQRGRQFGPRTVDALDALARAGRLARRRPEADGNRRTTRSRAAVPPARPTPARARAAAARP
ncbi:MAG: diguanylate cyclase [Actinomycetota bacterium]|nr:diguanylate cyclase [Actinomycetota bacterium]